MTHYMPMAELTDAIRRANTEPVTGTMLSSPIPVLQDDRLLIAVFESTATFDAEKGGMLLGPPERVFWFDPSTGVRIREEPREAGRALGNEKFEVPRTEYLALRAKLYDAYDKLLPAFARRATTVDAATGVAIATFKQIFPRFAGKLLAPHYEKIGAEWFAWLDRVKVA